MIRLNSELLYKIEIEEAEKIHSGDFNFLSSDEINKIAKELDIKNINEELGKLMKNKLIIWDQNSGVKSRSAEIIRLLYNSTLIKRNEVLRDIADIKYMITKKRIPKYNILTKSIRKPKIDIDKSEEKKLAIEIIDKVFEAFAEEYKFISEFQNRVHNSIFDSLESDLKDIVVVANTGAGKSLSYQLPMFLWIIKSKIKNFFDKNDKSKCYAILTFPRVVLAQDQYETIQKLSDVFFNYLKKNLSLPDNLLAFLKISIGKDFGGGGRKLKQKIYPNSDIIVTNLETLKNRIMDPIANSYFKGGVDFILYDEVHLYYGILGSNVCSLNGRLRNILSGKRPIFIGMSATIANPEKHCKKLFLSSSDLKKIDDRNLELQESSKEYHTILKPRMGRSTLGALINCTSCLLHNRRNGSDTDREKPNKKRPKAICFYESLDGIGRWCNDQNDFEYYKKYSMNVNSLARRGYPLHYQPYSRISNDLCSKCKNGDDIFTSFCDDFQKGNCWYFSNDDGRMEKWINRGQYYYPSDNIRFKKISSSQVNINKLSNIYELFEDNVDVSREKIDAIISTSVLEVGVDFTGINEIIMYGEVKDPATYKQKSGRGAREGNLVDGLFIMTVIPRLPLAQFYFRHFQRLVYPSMNPIPLEPKNPLIIKTHLYSSIFDWIALNNIDIYNIIINMEKGEKYMEDKLDKALEFITKNINSTKEYLRSFLNYFNIQDEKLIEETIESAINCLDKLLKEEVIDGETKKWLTWVYLGYRNPEISSKICNYFDSKFIKNKEAKEKISKVRAEYQKELSNLKLIFNKIKSDDSYSKLMNELKEIVGDG